MQIGVVYYSRTGHTAFLAEEIIRELKVAGHLVDDIRLETQEPLDFQARQAALKQMPAIEAYDVLIVGTPVHGGRISAPVQTFLEDLPSLSGKKVSFFLTHFFPRQWGAIQTIGMLEELSAVKEGETAGSVDVTWISLRRKKQIKAAVDELCKWVRG